LLNPLFKPSTTPAQHIEHGGRGGHTRAALPQAPGYTRERKPATPTPRLFDQALALFILDGAMRQLVPSAWYPSSEMKGMHAHSIPAVAPAVPRPLQRRLGAEPPVLALPLTACGRVRRAMISPQDLCPRAPHGAVVVGEPDAVSCVSRGVRSSQMRSCWGTSPRPCT
jgi:hypothetical protein